MPRFFVFFRTASSCVLWGFSRRSCSAWLPWALARMEYGSKNYLRQKQKVAKIHANVKHQRKDLLDKLSLSLVSRYDVICIENLDLHAMAQDLNFGKSVHDNVWGMFVRMLEYKCRREGKILVKVDRWFPSSQTCSSCGTKNPEVRDLSVREWICPECGAHHLRDRNAAVNIMKEGLAMLEGIRAEKAAA